MGEFLGIIIGLLMWVGGPIFLVVYLRRRFDVKPFNIVEDGKNVVMPKREVDNPWAERVFRSSAYGLVPNNIAKLMQRVSADKNEKVIGAVWTRHGALNFGYLIATTSYLRYVQTFPLKEDEFWQYNLVLEKESTLDKRLSINYSLFQVLSNIRRTTAFHKLYAELQQALLHENNLIAEPVSEKKDSSASSISHELERLANLHQQGVLSTEEFQKAKNQILDTSQTAPHKQRARRVL